MSEFFTWAFLATYAGATAATAILTQFLKEIKIPTQILSYIVALAVVVAATAATEGASNWSDWAILPFNAVLISLASNGIYEGIVRVKNRGSA